MMTKSGCIVDHRAPPNTRFRSFQTCLLVGLVALWLPAVTSFAAWRFHLVVFDPQPGELVAVVFAPMQPANVDFLAIVRSGGRPIRTSLGGAVVVAEVAEPGFARRVRALGGWLLLDPALVGGCGAPADDTSPSTQVVSSP